MLHLGPGICTIDLLIAGTLPLPYNLLRMGKSTFAHVIIIIIITLTLTTTIIFSPIYSDIVVLLCTYIYILDKTIVYLSHMGHRRMLYAVYSTAHISIRHLR
jgi:hypothetical protein